MCAIHGPMAKVIMRGQDGYEGKKKTKNNLGVALTPRRFLPAFGRALFSFDVPMGVGGAT